MTSKIETLSQRVAAPASAVEPQLYRVEDGAAYSISPVVAEWDGTESVLAWARSEEVALALAAQYDAGELQPDNRTIDGRIVVCLQAS